MSWKGSATTSMLGSSSDRTTRTELVLRANHSRSRRRDRRFFAVPGGVRRLRRNAIGLRTSAQRWVAFCSRRYRLIAADFATFACDGRYYLCHDEYSVVRAINGTPNNGTPNRFQAQIQYFVEKSIRLYCRTTWATAHRLTTSKANPVCFWRNLQGGLTAAAGKFSITPPKRTCVEF
jgi:hypothetical protein